MKFLATLLICMIFFCPNDCFSKSRETRGILIEFCGIDGAGKTTLIKQLQALLEKNKYRVKVMGPTRGDESFYPFFDRVSQIVSKSPELKILSERFSHEYFSFYILSQYSNIETALLENDFVILDRYLHSHNAYQQAFGFDLSIFKTVYQLLPIPDYTFILYLPVSTAITRIHSRGSQLEEYENECFLEKAQNELLLENPIKDGEKIIFIESTQSTDSMANLCEKVLIDRQLYTEMNSSASQRLWSVAGSNR